MKICSMCGGWKFIRARPLPDANGATNSVLVVCPKCGGTGKED